MIIFTATILEVVTMTDHFEKVMEKFRREGTKNFSRNDRQILATIRKNCLHIIKHNQEAIEILVEITRKRR